MQKVMRFLMIISGAVIISSFVSPQKERIHWVTLDQLQKLYAAEPRPILIDVYTDWCGWCKEMDRVTYHHKKLSAYVNQYFYAVKLDAECKDSLVFNNKIYAYNPAYKVNELAEYLLMNRMEFPSTVFLSSIDAQPAPLAGYLNAKEMEAPLKYFGDAVYKNKTFIEFNQGFKGEW